MRQSILLVVMFFCSGCSVFMAASSPGQPNLSVLQPGVGRAAVERELGRPISFTRKRSADIAVYQYVGADEVSYERAAAYAVADVVTLGVAELVTAPVEALQNDKHLVTVVYDREGRLKKAYQSVERSPLDKPESLIGVGRAEPVRASWGPKYTHGK